MRDNQLPGEGNCLLWQPLFTGLVEFEEPPQPDMNNLTAWKFRNRSDKDTFVWMFISKVEKSFCPPNVLHFYK